MNISVQFQEANSNGEVYVACKNPNRHYLRCRDGRKKSQMVWSVAVIWNTDNGVYEAAAKVLPGTTFHIVDSMRKELYCEQIILDKKKNIPVAKRTAPIFEDELITLIQDATEKNRLCGYQEWRETVTCADDPAHHHTEEWVRTNSEQISDTEVVEVHMYLGKEICLCRQVVESKQLDLLWTVYYIYWNGRGVEVGYSFK